MAMGKSIDGGRIFMKKRFLGLLLIASGTMALSACSLLDGLSDLIPSGNNGSGSNNNNGQQSEGHDF